MNDCIPEQSASLHGGSHASGKPAIHSSRDKKAEEERDNDGRGHGCEGEQTYEALMQPHTGVGRQASEERIHPQAQQDREP